MYWYVKLQLLGCGCGCGCGCVVSCESCEEQERNNQEQQYISANLRKVYVTNETSKLMHR